MHSRAGTACATTGRAHRTALAIGIALTFSTGGAQAESQVWVPVDESVHLMHFSGEDYVGYVTRIDLRSPAVSLVATRPSDRGLSLDRFAVRYQAVLALPANPEDSQLQNCGVASGRGQQWLTDFGRGCPASIGFGVHNEALMFDTKGDPHAELPEAWMTDVISGKGWLIRDGRTETGVFEGAHEVRPRTAIGLNADRTELYIAVVGPRLVASGPTPGPLRGGMTAAAFAKLLAGMPLHDAILLRDDTRATLAVAGQRLPAQGGKAEVSAAHFLGVRLRAGWTWRFHGSRAVSQR